MSKHTPLPWTAAEYDKSSQWIDNYGTAILAGTHGKDPFIFLPGWNPRHREDGEAIIRAVSCHEELLAALKAALENSYCGFVYDPTDFPGSWKDRAKAAIKKAEGKG